MTVEMCVCVCVCVLGDGGGGVAAFVGSVSAYISLRKAKAAPNNPRRSRLVAFILRNSGVPDVEAFQDHYSEEVTTQHTA